MIIALYTNVLAYFCQLFHYCGIIFFRECLQTQTKIKMVRLKGVEVLVTADSCLVKDDGEVLVIAAYSN
jgi:hypothetical protein